MRKCLMILTCCFILAGCATLKMERAEVADLDSISGTYNLIMVGGTFRADAERLVILDDDTDDYFFTPVTIPGRINTVSGLNANEALERAEQFFKDHCAYNGFDIRKLFLPAGNFVGYEIIPDYPPSLCEDGNVLQVGYSRGHEGEIKVYTWLILKRDAGGSKSSVEVVREN